MEYRSRRDFFIDSLADEFHLQKSLSVQGFWAGCDVLDAYSKPKSGVHASEKFSVKYFSFVPPTSGMFIWVSSTRKTYSRQLLDCD